MIKPIHALALAVAYLLGVVSAVGVLSYMNRPTDQERALKVFLSTTHQQQCDLHWRTGEDCNR